MELGFERYYIGEEGTSLKEKPGVPALYTTHLYSRRANRPGPPSCPQPGPLYQNAERTRDQSSPWEILDSGCLLSTSVGTCRTLFSCRGTMKRNLHLARVEWLKNILRKFWEEGKEDERRRRSRTESGDYIKHLLFIMPCKLSRLIYSEYLVSDRHQGTII